MAYPRLRTIAIYFNAQELAADAAADLHATAGLGGASIDSAPVTVDGEDGTVIALSVHGSLASQVEEIGERNGGRIVANVPEEWL